jgi:hypothetical protein
MSAPLTPSPDVVPAPALSEPQRIANIYYAPSRTFEDIRRSAKFWGPFLVMVVMSYVGVFALQQKITTDELTDSILANMSEKQKSRIEAAPPEQQANIRASIGRNAKVFSYAGWVLYTIVALIIAAVLMATFNFALGKAVGYGTSVAIVFYSFLPSVIKTILFVITLFAGIDPANFNIENPVATNPAFWMNKNDMPVLYPLMQTLDIFTIWQTVLIGLGFAVVTRTKKSTAIIAVVAWLALYTLLKMGAAAIF